MSDDPLDVYFAGLKVTAYKLIGGEIAIQDFLCSSAPSEAARSLVETRTAFATESDCDNVALYMDSYDLSTWPDTQKPSVLLVWDDIVSASRHLQAERDCQPYSKEQPLFQVSPTIAASIDWNNPPELVQIKIVPWVDQQSVNIIANAEQWGRPSPLLRDELITYLRELGNSCHVSVRLDAHNVTPANIVRLQEAVVRQADQNWWRTLAIHPGESKYSEYLLDAGGSFWEQVEFRGGIRRLEASFLRRNSGHLMSSVEELSYDTPDLLAGLMLHCDSAAPMGTDWSDAVLGHIDGAINVYTGPGAQSRYDQRHSDGKVVNATMRTHLFRIDGAPVKIITELAQLFFRSKFLVRDWLQDQFGGQ